MNNFIIKVLLTMFDRITALHFRQCNSLFLRVKTILNGHILVGGFYGYIVLAITGSLDNILGYNISQLPRLMNHKLLYMQVHC